MLIIVSQTTNGEPVSLKRFFVLIAMLIAGFVCGGSSISEASTIRVSNPKVELELSPGETYSGEIMVENPDAEEVKLRVYAEDWVYINGGTGEKKFTPAGTTPLSCSKWITFTPGEAMLPPFGKVTARYALTVPPDAKGAYYSVLFFETILGTAQNEDGVNVLVAGRVGALFLIHIKGTVDRQGDVSSVKVTSPEGNKPMEIETTFKNTGNVDITLKGNLLLMDSEGKVAGRGDLNAIYTFPGTTETRRSQWVGRLPKGSYDLLLTYDLGQGKTLVKDETVVVS